MAIQFVLFKQESIVDRSYKQVATPATIKPFAAHRETYHKHQRSGTRLINLEAHGARCSLDNMTSKESSNSALAMPDGTSPASQHETPNHSWPRHQHESPTAANGPGPPPDGGLQAWTQVFMGHLVLINSWGYLTSFGLFQSYYKTTLSATPSAISWIGSVQILLVYLIGTFSGRGLDAGYYHLILAFGSFLQILAVFMTSISTQYWQLFLAQGICKGLGDGLLFCPTVSLVATYFSKNRVLAMACTASGGATGGIIFPLIAQQLLPKIGFGWTVRVMAFVICFNSAVVLAIARVRLPPRRAGPLVEWSAFRELPYTLFCSGMFLNLWAVYFAYFYVSRHFLRDESLDRLTR